MNTSVYFSMVARAKKLLAAETDRKFSAQRFVSAVLREYLSRDIDCPVQPFLHPLTTEMGFYARTQSPAVAAYLIGSTYSMLLPEEYRQKNGVFYTPPALANRLLDQVEACGVDWRNARVLDPACGCGVFLLLAAGRMLKACTDMTPEQRINTVERNLKGIELDAFSGWMSEVFIQEALRQDIAAGDKLPTAFVEVRDSLTFYPRDLEAYDVVIGNPPYGKIKLEPADRHVWSRGLYGHANLYGLFTDLAVRLAAPGGIIAYVTPTSFLGGHYFRSLRKLLRKEAPPVTFDFVTRREGVFAGVLQETMLSVFRKDNTQRNVSVSYLKVSGIEDLFVTTNGSYPVSEGGLHGCCLETKINPI